MNTLHPALLSLVRLTGQRAERASTISPRAGLDEPIHHLLHVRREKLHRAAVLGLLLLTLLAGSDSEAAPREHDASGMQTVQVAPEVQRSPRLTRPQRRAPAASTYSVC